MVKPKTNKKVNENLTNEPCPKCALLGHTSINNQNILLMVTLSPSPNWKNYISMLPDRQYVNLHNVLHDSTTNKKIKKYFGQYLILGEHYEFNKRGQLHSHNLVSIPKEFGGYDRNLITISKHYSNLIGEHGLNSMISAHVRFVDDLSECCRYLDKENAYESIHYEKPITIIELFNQFIPEVEAMDTKIVQNKSD